MVSSCVDMVKATFIYVKRSNINCISGMRTKRPRHRGLGKTQRKDQEDSEQKTLDWMKLVTKLPYEHVLKIPELVSVYGPDPVRHRVFWIRGISRGIEKEVNTVTKALERLKEKGSVWEDPIPSNVRMFQLTFEEGNGLPDWKWYYNHSLRSLKLANEQGKRHHSSLRIPRGRTEDEIREQINTLLHSSIQRQ